MYVSQIAPLHADAHGRDKMEAPPRKKFFRGGVSAFIQNKADALRRLCRKVTVLQSLRSFYQSIGVTPSSAKCQKLSPEDVPGSLAL